MIGGAHSWLTIQCQEGVQNSHLEPMVGRQPMDSTLEALCRDRVEVGQEGWIPGSSVAYSNGTILLATEESFAVVIE